MRAFYARFVRNGYLLASMALVFLLAFVPWVLGRGQSEVHAQSAPVPATNKLNSPSTGETGQATREQEVIKVGVYILSIGNLDTTTGSYDADFYLNFQCAPMPCDPSKFDIMNAADITMSDDQTSAESVKEGKSFYRVRASLRTNLNLRDFPFDHHTIEIVLEDKNKEEKFLVYTIDEKTSGIDPSAVVSGWQNKAEITGKVDTHVYPNAMFPPYSRARFTMEIYHPWFASFMKGLFAAIVIVLVGMLSFVMSHDATTDRLALTSSTLVGAILYHLTLTSSIPPIGYLTFADSFMMMNYVFVSAALGISVILMLLMENKCEDQAIRLHKQTRLIVPVAWLVASVALTLFQFVIIK